MLKYLFLVVVSVFFFNTYAQDISYNLKMEKPQNHYFQVEMELNGFQKSELLVKMPIWSPGSYLAREFAKNVNLVKAVDSKGNKVEVKKINKNTWKVMSDKKDIKISYEVYAFELTVRTSFLDLTHGFVSNSGVFMYVDGYKNNSGKLNVFPHASFSTITTALEKTAEKEYIFENYDQLVDCPLEIGNQKEFTFKAAGVKHRVGIYGEGNYDVDLLKKDMATVVEGATDIFKVNPNKEYTFIIHNVVDGQGGLEHSNSTVLSVNRWTYTGKKYKGFLKLVAHEYFHLWNVKRIRPVELGPFDYDSENYTSLLWVMEGFTSYYEKMILLRQGIYSKDDFLNSMKSSLNYVEGSVGARVQPVSHASFDAWIKAYRPNENSRNTTMSYYSRGSLMAMLLDAKIIKKYNGEKCLDDFMQVIYKKYYLEKNRGFSEEEFKKELELFLGENMDEFYSKYIDGTEIPNYDEVMSPIGLRVIDVATTKANAGLSLTTKGNVVVVRGIRSESGAETAGISVNDEIIGCNGYRVSKTELDELLKNAKSGDEFELLIARDQILFSVIMKVTDYNQPKFEFELDLNENTNKLIDFWLR